MMHEFTSLAPRAKVHLVDHGNVLLKMFVDKGHAYAARILVRDGVDLRLGIGVKAIGPGHVTLSDGIDDQDALRHLGRRPDGCADRRGERVAAGSRRPDRRRARTSRVAGFPGVLVIGDIANIPAKDGKTHPQLGSVALQSGSWAAKTILADLERQGREAVLLSRQGDHGDDRPGRGHRPGQGDRAARQARVRGLARRPCRADDRRQQSRRCVQELGAWTTSARSGRHEALDRSGTPRMVWEEDVADEPVASGVATT